jgi:membrane protein DedA with SNARE-associated domain
MEQIIQSVLSYINEWGYYAIFIAAAIESANIPLSSEVLFGFAGYLVYLNRLDFSAVIVWGLAGELIGSTLSYLIGYYGGPAFVGKYGKYVLLSPKKLKFVEKWFARYGLVAVLIARMLPLVRTFISLPAGFSKVVFWKFILYTALGSAVWITVLVYAGATMGEEWIRLQSYGHTVLYAIIAVAIAVAVALLLPKKL